MEYIFYLSILWFYISISLVNDNSDQHQVVLTLRLSAEILFPMSRTIYIRLSHRKALISLCFKSEFKTCGFSRALNYLEF